MQSTWPTRRIRTDVRAISIPLELSRSKWRIRFLSPGAIVEELIHSGPPSQIRAGGFPASNSSGSYPHHAARGVLKRRSQKNRRMGWNWFHALARSPLPTSVAPSGVPWHSMIGAGQS